jgi:flagellar basal-body rod modification protein FlgD
MASAISPITSATTAGATSSGASTSLGGSAPSEQMFLQLLVAQLKNQDPLSPTDSTQFVSQLAQFSELEQVIGIRGDIETQMSSTTATTGATGTTDTTDTTGTTGTSGTTGTTGTTGTSSTQSTSQT